MNVIRSNVGPVVIRQFASTDSRATRDVYRDAILRGARAKYNYSQRIAWAGSKSMPPSWPKRLVKQHTLVATLEGRVIGFMSATQSGYLDLAFVSPELMGAGVAQRLYTKLEDWARLRELDRMTTEASHLARPFFLRQGWTLLAQQIVERNGQEIENFRMEKEL